MAAAEFSRSAHPNYYQSHSEGLSGISRTAGYRYMSRVKYLQEHYKKSQEWTRGSHACISDGG